MEAALLDSLASEHLVDEIVRREAECIAFGPFARQRLLDQAPDKVRGHLDLARRFPNLRGARQTFASPDVNDFPPSSFTPVASTNAETNLWTPAIWTPIPANDARAGKVYKVQAGGIISNTSTPTTIWTPRFGQSSTPSSNVTLGASATVTSVASLSNSSWYLEFILGFRQLGLAASGSTATGNGFVCIGGPASTAAQVIGMGSAVPATLDTTTAQGLIVSLTWSASSPSNTCTCQWALIRSLN